VYLPIAVFAIGLLILLSAFRAFDKLIILEWSQHRDAWERDGSPHPFYAAWPGKRSFKSSLATQRCSFVWLFRTPAWIGSDPEAFRLLRRLRLLVGLWNVVVIPAFLTIVVWRG
jgi:hypothetical protein